MTSGGRRIRFQGPAGALPNLTKRIVLSQTARLFDPLSWLAPVTVRAKLLIQAAWLQHREWINRSHLTRRTNGDAYLMSCW